jgi:hypothetical protein
VVSSTAQFADLWQRAENDPPLPAIDFRTHLVLLFIGLGPPSDFVGLDQLEDGRLTPRWAPSLVESRRNFSLIVAAPRAQLPGEFFVVPDRVGRPCASAVTFVSVRPRPG